MFSHIPSLSVQHSAQVIIGAGMYGFCLLNGPINKREMVTHSTKPATSLPSYCSYVQLQRPWQLSLRADTLLVVLCACWCCV